MSKSSKGGRNQVSGRVSAACWHATLVANAPWKPLNSVKVKFGTVLNRCRVGKLVSTIRAYANLPKRDGTRFRRGKRSLLACRTRCKCSMDTTCNLVSQTRYQCHAIGGKSDRLGSHCNWSRVRMSFNIRERDTSYC